MRLVLTWRSLQHGRQHEVMDAAVVQHVPAQQKAIVTHTHRQKLGLWYALRALTMGHRQTE